MKSFTRRDLLKSTIAMVGGSALSAPASAATTTPGAAEGPFYPTVSMRMNDVDNDLVKVAGMVTEAGGEIIRLNGKVTSKEGDPLAGYRVEIWQCDVNGRYLHTSDNRNVTYDKGFQGFGHDITDSDGSYRFRTIKPTTYPSRTPHIHVKVYDGNRERLTTQFYLHGHALNSSDFLYRRMSTEQALSVSMVFDKNNDVPETTVNMTI
ncbi:MAG: protocatechuate 3,4-dioxygenase [Gammaproteobacteria bacterium]|nr:protocatechuate 3,4-dioxygenase [Gammaproteobacteria bacterium]